MASAVTIGVRREDKNKWERRAPLNPEAVGLLVREHGFRVIVQPSSIRVYPDQSYAEQGATISDDLSPCSVILAVKEVPIPLLLDKKAYMFFSHTIKGQAANMPLLDALLERGIRMVDYEAITAGGARGSRRLVAFGRYAGIAGMIDFLSGMGQRFLSLGHSTPFLNIAATWQYPTLDAAYAAITAAGQVMLRYGLPHKLAPLTVVVTGDGNVSKGAQEVLNLLPIKWVQPGELQAIVEGRCSAASGEDRGRYVFAAIAREEHMVRRRAGPPPSSLSPPRSPVAATSADGVFSIADDADEQRSNSGSATPGPTAAPGGNGDDGPAHNDHAPLPFDKHHYRAHPELYEPIFHTRVAPFTSILVNCMYWEGKFPRLLTVGQAQALQAEGLLRLLGVCDITCDFQGSVEFLKEFTSIERPFYLYDVGRDAVVHGNMDAPGVLYHAVDHLPCECPKDATDHFSTCLVPFLPDLARADPALSMLQQPDLPAELRGAVLCEHGALTPNFSYIAALRAANERAGASRGLRRVRNESFVTLDLAGHLFDSGIINRVLDLIEDASASAQILDFKVGKDRSTPTEMRVQLFCPPPTTPQAGGGGALASLISHIDALAASVGVALHITTDGGSGGGGAGAGSGGAGRRVPRPITASSKRVLVLGAGYVSGPLVEYLLRRPGNFLTVASQVLPEAEGLTRGRLRATPVALDVFTQAPQLEALVAAHDLVVSLVPAPCHPAIARVAITHRKHMVTASYVSPEMGALHETAAAARVVILNEAGLDPGIDHMTAARMIDDAHAAGGTVVGFSSNCGGLPAPEAANNPLGYKFSWSPRGALSAARNGARYLRDGAVVEVPPAALLTSVAPLKLNPALALEVLPNRDALPYADKYRIAGPALRSMFRGTIRYPGFAGHMAALAALGFLELEPRPVPRGTGAEGAVTLRDLLAAHAGGAGGSNGDGGDDDDAALFACVVGRLGSATGSALGDLLATLTAAAPSLASLASGAASLASGAILRCSGVARHGELRGFLAWCGLFSRSLPAPLASAPGQPAPSACGTYSPLDTLTALLAGKREMSFAPGERDMALMRHEVDVAFPDGRVERRTGTLIEYATGGHSAMARTVGFTAAAAAQLILDGANLAAASSSIHPGATSPRGFGAGGASSAAGSVSATPPARPGLGAGFGVLVPTTRAWYGPILDRLEEEGIRMVEGVEVLQQGGGDSR